jgi:ERCC4-related helicase
LADLLPGTEVSARGLRWEVAFVQPAGEQKLYRLRCLEGGLRGREFDLLSPFEQIEPIPRAPDPTKPGRLRDWRTYHEAFLLEQELGPHALLAAQPGRLRPMAYQLVPVLRALSMPRPRLLLADDVGLGKTIQAGLVLAELIARRRAHRVLIVAPAGPLLLQWKAEMRDRVGLRFEVLDAAALKQVRFGTELGANPFDQVALGLISIDFAKQERVLQDLERSQYDVVVIDEAHHCASLGGSTARDDSLRRRLAEVLAQRSDALLLLTATPHDGYEPHFASLMELLDASLVDGRGALRGTAYQRHVVRRLKRHIIDLATGKPMFRERKLVPLPVAVDPDAFPDYVRLQRGLLALIAPQLRRALKKRRFGDALAFIALMKRSVSTAHACASTLRAVAERLSGLADAGGEAQEARHQRVRTLSELHRRQERFGTLSFEEERDQASLEAEDIASELLETEPAEIEKALRVARSEARRERGRLKDVTDTRDALRELAQLAEVASGTDPKLARVLEVLRTIRRDDPQANVLIYTEFADSQDALVEVLSKARKDRILSGEIVSLSGADDDQRRQQCTARFTAENNLILVSTDATAEGLNLHERCHHLVHLELPYNPNRLEQRNGRIDRFGQEHEPVIHYLYLQGTFEERLLMRLVAKYEKQKERLQFVPNTLGISVSEADRGLKLLEGLAEEDGTLFQNRPVKLEDPAALDDVENAAYRDLLAELDQVFRDFESKTHAHTWLGHEGLGADSGRLANAEAARDAGVRLGAVDLTRFVSDAIEAEAGGEVAKVEGDDSVLLKLPPAWRHGLDELPGYDPQARTLRVTTDVRRIRDADGRPLGFLGRAHPIVRRALDRVRHLQFTGGGEWLDRRVAVARVDGTRPGLLFTCLGRVGSRRGREFERLMAVEWYRDASPRVLPDSSEWLQMANDDRAEPGREIWKRHFAWANPEEPRVLSEAQCAFAPLAEAFRTEYQMMLEHERRELDLWLVARASDICGKVAAQGSLFDAPELPPWKTATHPRERLAAYALDRQNSPRSRAEAQTALVLFKRRVEDQAASRSLEPAHVSLLGVLLLVPGSGAVS